MFYTTIAPWYDYIFPPSPEQLDHVEMCTGNVNGVSILDVGCGTGGLAYLLAGAGAVVTGVDPDPGMLQMALSKSRDNMIVNFVPVSMEEIGQSFNSSTFGGICCFGNTLAHLPGSGKVLEFFRQSRMLLKRGGKLMLQVVNYDYVLDNMVNHLPTIDNQLVRFERVYNFIDNSQIEFITTLTVKNNSMVITNSVLLFPLRSTLVFSLLREAGFRDVMFHGGFSGQDFNSSSPLLVVTASKV